MLSNLRKSASSFNFYLFWLVIRISMLRRSSKKFFCVISFWYFSDKISQRKMFLLDKMSLRMNGRVTKGWNLITIMKQDSLSLPFSIQKMDLRTYILYIIWLMDMFRQSRIHILR